ncbi:DUF1684 domain-containing protein [Streptomyces sp. MST-110588]|uniref:DUF1684 domain-containing protein n=1 Tax=Streptomyces sp. MST-110588 TaxID=2833628 RepID=UPI001F5DB022|nr:DUF1684 domain-containing protein [Streptomyces sp. MST-110588]UNO38384.1 DUF1684 domain-containing protein [Streptomyces sp. MST-110588]
MAYVQDTAGEQFTQDWKEWRAGWEQWLVAPHGWLSARSLFWLDSTPRRYPGLPGLWSQDQDEVVIDPDGVTMSFGGESFGTVRRISLTGAPDDQRVTAGGLEVGITCRGTCMIVVYDPATPARRNFRGVPVFAPDPDWVLTGRYEPYASSHSIKLSSVDPGLDEHTYDSPGLVHLQYERQTYTLQVLRSGGTLNTVFADATSGVTTYGAGRSLMISEVGEDGLVRLDFNRAVNLPCAFSDNFPICPVPPPGNRLPFAIEAGERTPREKTG